MDTRDLQRGLWFMERHRPDSPLAAMGSVKGIYWLVCKIMVSMVRYPVKALGFAVVMRSVAFQSR